MKHIYLQMAAGLAATFTIGASSACAQQQDDGSEPVVFEEAADLSWNDEPQTPGTWTYVNEPGESLGLFGDANPVHLFVLRCDKESRQIGIARRGESQSELMMRVRTETAERLLNASEVPGYGLVAANLPANDPLLDAMAITKGRFAIEVEGMEPLYIPAWAEVTRVIEDCR
ncbi:hypothetical protein [Altererythrobacter ishigakiensis]|jgi:hypothetical protein|uniref:Uncharacterized protein n=1 Tax=Altererythrobacter ishigakiensis TaxID=476157 RepID=A0A562UN47_9SPHN|nr:hypothetical protein [Altererythrobacter ishigakiensis]MDX1704012.1 hypothetical protein [Altererythrobacter ishigakiensis]TWJ07041.1 hypothetical protein JN10_2589 [Altererythrobacter ishigakiensis]